MNRDRVVVVGGGLCGLLAGRVLSGHFDQVTILEKDSRPEPGTAHRGVPQSPHIHVLLARGRNLLAQWFEQLDDQLVQAGAPELDWARDTAWLNRFGWGARYESGIRTRSCSRILLEQVIRDLVATQPHVELVYDTRAKGLISDSGRTRITGVETKSKGHAQIKADLVVHTAGRNGLLGRWLEPLGLASPPVRTVKSFLGYATRWYERPANSPEAWQQLYIQTAAPEHLHGGVISPIENGKWIVTLVGAAKQYPPDEPEAFNRFARDLRDPALFNAIENAEPSTPVSIYRRTENVWVGFGRMNRWPRGLVALGDSVCALNPVYGQGMTMAAIGVELLDQALSSTTRSIKWEHGFQKKLDGALRSPWTLATLDDARVPGCEGASSDLRTRLMHAYVDRVVRASTRNQAASKAFLNVLHLMAKPAALFRPGILAHAILG